MKGLTSLVPSISALVTCASNMYGESTAYLPDNGHWSYSQVTADACDGDADCGRDMAGDMLSQTCAVVPGIVTCEDWTVVAPNRFCRQDTMLCPLGIGTESTSTSTRAYMVQGVSGADFEPIDLNGDHYDDMMDVCLQSGFIVSKAHIQLTEMVSTSSHTPSGDRLFSK